MSRQVDSALTGRAFRVHFRAVLVSGTVRDIVGDAGEWKLYSV